MFAPRRRNALLVIAIACCSVAPAIAAAQDPPFTIPLQLDDGGQPLDGAVNRYRIQFAAALLPPAREWSLALYQLPDQSRVKNSIDRYAITSRMLPSLQRNPDGSLTIYIQRDSPSGSQKANWLPAPHEKFMLRLQLVDPAPSVLTGAWESPPIERVE